MIRQLNDRLRCTFMGGKVLIVGDIPDEVFLHIVAADPPEDSPEGDFVSVTVDGEVYFAKIDWLGPDPSDRVMTIFHSRDY